MSENETRNLENEQEVLTEKKREKNRKRWRVEMGKNILKLHREGYSPTDIALLIGEEAKQAESSRSPTDRLFQETNQLLAEIKLLIKKHTRHTNIQLRKEILRLDNDGYNQREIARQLNISLATVNLWINRNGNLEFLHKSGRSRKTTTEQDDEIYSMSQSNPFQPATAINRHLTLNICAQTVRNRLVERGLKNFKAPQKFFLRDVDKAKRKEFAKVYEHWNEEKWENACFSDEKTFQSFGNGITRVWRPKLTRWNEEANNILVTRFDPSVVSSQKKSGRFSISIWGCIGKKNHLHLIRNGKRMDSIYYLENILKRYIKSNDNDEFIFIQDNAPVHRAIRVEKWLSEENIKILKIPAYSPDLNPIENLWARMEYLTRNRTPTSKENLWDIVKETYDDIINDTVYIQKLIRSMPKRLKEVLRVDGNAVKY